MLSSYVLPGQKIDLIPLTNGRKKPEEARQYKSSVYEVLSEDRLEVTMPMEQSKLILLPVDGEYDVFFYTQKGLYQCECRIAERYKRDNVYILVLELISNLRKYQRREFYRFSCALDMSTRQLLDSEAAAFIEGKEFLELDMPFTRSIIVDISGGGARFITSQRYNADSLIFCKYSLKIQGELKEYKLVGKILRVSELPNKKGVFEHRLQYVKIDDAVREEIIKFIFEEERKNRQKTI